MASVRSRRREPSTAARMSSGLLVTPVCLPSLVEGEPELGGDHDIVADRLQRLTHQFLVVERAVDLGGVEQGDAPVHRGTEERDHLLAWWSWPERLAHAHAAEAEGGHLQALRAERACVHCSSPSSQDFYTGWAAAANDVVAALRIEAGVAQVSPLPRGKRCTTFRACLNRTTIARG